MLKKILFIFLCTMILISSGCNKIKKKQKTAVTYDVTGNFSVTCLKTEGAECFLMQTENSAILIDSAKYDNAKEIIEYLKSKNINKIDYFIITQFSDENIGSANTVLKKLEVKNVYQTSYIPKNTRLYEKYISTLKYKEITPHTITKDELLTVDDAHFQFFYCDNNTFNNEQNNCSLIFKVTHGENSFLFSGNIKSERMKDFIDSKKDSAKFIKIPSHGKFKNMTTFISDGKTIIERNN